MDRRNFLKLTAAGIATAAVGRNIMTATSAEALERPYTPYTDDSFFKSRTDGAPIEEARTAEFLNFMKTFPDQKKYAYPRIKGVLGSSWGTPWAEGTASDPIWKLTGTMNAKCNILKTDGFHAPEWFGKMITGTSDSPFCVMDTANGFTVFGGKASVVGPNTIQVGAAGITYHSSNGLHYKNPRSNDSRNFTGRGRISDAMAIRKDLVDYGIEHNTGLNHVLHMFIAETDVGYCHPMIGDEGNRNGFGAEGERIAIRPEVDLSTRGLSPAGLVIARTLKYNGAYIGDNAGNESTLKAEQANSYRNVWGTSLTQDSLKGITWDDFFVLPKGWQG